MVSHAAVPFESKLVMLFVGGVLGSYLIWGAELTAFKDNRIVLGMLIFVVMLLALYGLVVHFKSPDRVLWAERYAVYEGRLMSTYICPNHFAHLMQMLLPFCLVFLFIPQSGLYLKVLSAYSFIVFLPPMFLTESRAGWLGSIAAVGVTICFMALRRSKKLFLLLVFLIPLFSVLILLAGWHYSETFQRRAKPVVDFLQHQSEEGIGSEVQDFRPQTWMDTIDMIKDAPLTGHGPGNYRYTFPEYRNRFKGRRIVTGHPHNEYLELIAGYGLIGFGLFSVAWLYGLIWILIKSLRAEETRHAFIGFAFLGTAAGTMVHSFFDFQMHVYPNALIFALLAAITVGPLVSRRTKTNKRRAVESEELANSSLLSTSGQPSVVNRQKRSEVETTRRQQSDKVDRENKTSDIRSSTKGTLWLTKSFHWLLAVGYLLGTFLCLQVMSSAYLRALGDKTALANPKALNSKPSAQKYYELSARIDSQNWRADKGMSELIYAKRYYSLDKPEKIQLAVEERKWFEKSYAQNPKDPEILSGYGKCLIFLGKNLQTADGKQQIDNSQAQGSSLQAQGLDLLREACRYRKFNDNYWWTLGVELRKAGKYKESLKIFQAMEKIERTPSSRKNIKWIQARLKGEKDSSVGRETVNSSLPDLRLKQEQIDLDDLYKLMEQ